MAVIVMVVSGLLCLGALLRLAHSVADTSRRVDGVALAVITLGLIIILVISLLVLLPGIL